MAESIDFLVVSFDDLELGALRVQRALLLLGIFVRQAEASASVVRLASLLASLQIHYGKLGVLLFLHIKVYGILDRTVRTCRAVQGANNHPCEPKLGALIATH